MAGTLTPDAPVGHIVPYGSPGYSVGYPGDEVWANWPWDEAPGIKSEAAHAARSAYYTRYGSSGKAGNGAHGSNPYRPADGPRSCAEGIVEDAGEIDHTTNSARTAGMIGGY